MAPTVRPPDRGAATRRTNRHRTATHRTATYRATRRARHVVWCALFAGLPAAAQPSVPARHIAHVVSIAAAPADIAEVPPALQQPLTLRLRHVTVGDALREVSTRAGLALSYSRAVVPLDRVVSVHVENGSVLDAMRQVLAGVDVELWISAEGRMALVPAERRAAAQPGVRTGVVAGRVTAADGNSPVAGVTVRVAGTQRAAVTNAEGRFTLGAVPEGRRLLYAQRLGFARDSQTVDVAAGQTATANFTLRAVAATLSEVVAIGYGTTTRSQLTGAVATVSGTEATVAPQQTVDQVLQGRAPGVQITTQSGQPGAGATVRIRGGNSISAGNDPLYVIDGVQILGSASGANTNTLQTQGQGGLNPLALLNPDDIESIDVLKDASTAAIYGARAANGVILITTKRGREGRPAISVGGYYGDQSVRHRLSLLDATQFATLVNQAYANAGQPLPYTASQIATMGAGTDWQDAIFRSAPMGNVDASISGGTGATRYYLSGNVLRDQGVVIGTNMNRGTFRANLDQTLSSRVRVGAQLTLARSGGQILPNGGAGGEVSSVIINAVTAPPTLPVSSGGTYFTGVNPLTGRPFSNPVASALLITNQEQQNRVIGNGYAEWQVVPDLLFRTTLGTDYLSSNQNFYSPSNTLPGANYGGYGSRGNLQVTTWQNENTLDYRHSLLGAALDLLGGASIQNINSVNISGTSQGFSTDNLGVNGLNSAKTYVGVYTGNPHSTLISYFGRANVSAGDDRYLLTLTGRSDGSSRFGTNHQYAFFPSVAVGWRLAREGFVQRLGVFDELKLRVSDGKTGNQDIGNYASLARLASTVYVFGGGRTIGYTPNSIANPDLKWETTNQFDAGLDVGVLKNRVALTADYYQKHTSDLLFNVPIPTTSGFGTSLQNIGSLQNRGVELGLNTTNTTGPLGWTSTLNLTWNRQKVLALGGGTTQVINPYGVGAGANQNPTIIQVGQPLNAFYGYVYSGMSAGGQPTYKDLNGDGKLTDADRTILGSAQPNYTGGFTNNFSYGPFRLSAFLQFSVGNKIYNINRALLTNTAGNGNQVTDVLNAGSNGIPVPKIGNTFDTRPSSLFLESGTYLRGKNLRLDYSVPRSVLNATRYARLDRLQLYVSAQNWFTSTKYSGYDPEISEYALSNLAQGIDFGTYPQPRQITFGLTAGF